MEVAIALILGAALAVQAGANVQLAGAMGSPFGASTVQVALAAAGLLGLSALAGTLGTLDAIPSLELWHLLGGLATALYISAGILVFPRLGAVSAVGLFVAGQMLASLAVDALGLLGVTERPLGAGGVVGVAAVLAGAALVIRAGAVRTAVERRSVQASEIATHSGEPGPRLPAPGIRSRATSMLSDAVHRQPRPGLRRAMRRTSGHLHWAWAALALAAGVGLALQGPINAQLRADLDAPVTAGAFSFVVATAALVAVLAVARSPLPRAPRAMPWWGWLGALVGASYVTTVPLLIPEIGAAVTIGLTVAGQQLASLAVDQGGLLRLPRRPLTAPRIAGVALLLAGVLLLTLIRS